MKPAFYRQVLSVKKDSNIKFLPKIRLEGAELFHADFQDTTKLAVTFRNFCGRT